MFLAAYVSCLERIVQSEVSLVHVLKVCCDAIQISVADKLAGSRCQFTEEMPICLQECEREILRTS